MKPALAPVQDYIVGQCKDCRWFMQTESMPENQGNCTYYPPTVATWVTFVLPQVVSALGGAQVPIKLRTGAEYNFVITKTEWSCAQFTPKETI